MILTTLEMDVDNLERRTGWHITPEGACKGDQCIPLPPTRDGRLEVSMLSERLGMPLLHDSAHNLWCLGPESGGHALMTAAAPDLVLPDLSGTSFALSTLHGQKVLLVAWASW